MVITETNHNVNNFRYQIISASCDDIMGSYVFDPCLLNMASVAKLLWRIKDYSSDLLVICLAFSRTIKNLVILLYNNNVNIVVIRASLFSVRSRLYGKNAKYVRYEEIF